MHAYRYKPIVKDQLCNFLLNLYHLNFESGNLNLKRPIKYNSPVQMENSCNCSAYFFLSRQFRAQFSPFNAFYTEHME